MAIGAHEKGGRWADIWLHGLEDNNKSRLTFVNAANVVWSPTGDQIAFSRSVPGGAGISLVPSDGSADPIPVINNQDQIEISHWSRDGRYLLYSMNHPDTQWDIWYVLLEGDRTPVGFLQGPAIEIAPQVSPDGRYIAYVSNESGQYEVYVTSFPEGAGQWQVSINEGMVPLWNHRGDALYYVERNTLMKVSVSTTSGFSHGTPQRLLTEESTGTQLLADSFPPKLFNYRYAVTPDDNRIMLIRNDQRSTVYLVQNWVKEFEKSE